MQPVPIKIEGDDQKDQRYNIPPAIRAKLDTTVSGRHDYRGGTCIGRRLCKVCEKEVHAGHLPVSNGLLVIDLDRPAPFKLPGEQRYQWHETYSTDESQDRPYRGRICRKRH